MEDVDFIAEMVFDIINSPDKLTLRIERPLFDDDKQSWGCTFHLGRPLDITRTIYGEYSLQALFLSLKVASANLYGSALYKNGQIGIFGKYGGYLNIPAPKEFSEIAPYPF